MINQKTKKQTTIRRVVNGRIYLQATFNNTIITLTDEDGRPLGWVSAGSLGFKGAKKSSPYSSTLVAKTAVEKASQIGLRDVKVYLSGVGPGRDSAARVIITSGLNIISIADITPIPHNGCRPKKPRRV